MPPAERSLERPLEHTVRGYRPEIDGLRALAVLSVMLFHAGFDAFAGGYVGVDVFFVISGYLITGILLGELRDGSFSFLGFIERRARRILPALFLVLLACLPLAWVWSMPLDMRDFSAALLSVIGFASNIWFWRSNGYFDHQAETSPLLHTWSLAIEEQYYLLFPLLLWLLWRARKRGLLAVFIVVGMASLAIAEWGAHHKPTPNFYLLPTRAWEFLIGALLAVRSSPATGRHAARAQALALAGVALIGWAVWRYDANTPFPGLAALLPTLGAALLIRHAQAETWVGRVLASRLLVGVGLVSYSGYLWHQPIFAFVRQRSLAPPEAPLLLALVALSLSLAWLSWKVIETPWRDRRRFSRRQFVGSAIGCSAFLAAFGVAGVVSDGFPGRLSAVDRALMAYASYDFRAAYRDATCFLRTEQAWRDFLPDCASLMPDAALIWGDSHAAALSHGVREVLGDVHQYSASGCPPLVGVHRRSFPNCLAINEHVIDVIERLRPRLIILHANWVLHAEQQPVLRLRDTLDRIAQASPTSRVLIVGAVPQWYLGLPSAMLKMKLGLQPDQHLVTPIHAELVALDTGLQALAAQRGAEFKSALQMLCNGARCPVTLRDAGQVTLTAWDYGHLTTAGSVLLARRLFGTD